MKHQGNKPFAPVKLPFFYGWVILGAGIIGMIMSVPGQTVGVSAFTEDLLSDLQVTRDNLSLAYLVGTLFSALIITWAGKLYDTYGARIMSFTAGVMLGLMLLYLTRVDVIAQAFQKASWISPALATFILLAFGFWGIRFFGQGMLTMVSRNMVMKWFVKRRGMANAVLGIFTAFGFSMAPKILSQFIERYEWRNTWLLLATLIGVLFAIFVLVIFRDNPESCGMKPDGKIRTRRPTKRPPSLPDRDYNLREARNTLSFWTFTLALALTSLFVTGLTFHVVSVFESAGMSEDKAFGIFLPSSIIAILFQFFFSYLSDFIKLKYLLIILMTGMLASSAGLLLLEDIPLAYFLLVSGNGIMWGMYAVLVGVTWPRFFGLKHLGAISGFSLSLIVTGSALGPYLFSLSMKYSGGYAMVAWLCLGISVVLFFLAFKADNPFQKAGLPKNDSE